MKCRLNLPGIRLLAYAVLFIGPVIADHAEAASALGTPVWDIDHIPSVRALAERAHIAIFGDVFAQGYDRVIMRGQTDAGKSIKVDIRRLGAGEQHRIKTQCARRPCSGIVIGFIIAGRLIALNLSPFHSGNLLSGSPALTVPSVSAGAQPLWRCPDRRHCT
jgi:hypothetical protein